jgi:hypothetical protein
VVSILAHVLLPIVQVEQVVLRSLGAAVRVEQVLEVLEDHMVAVAAAAHPLVLLALRVL